MQLPRDGQEYAHITLTGLPADITSIDASLDRETWQALPLINGEALFLLRGPDYAGTDGTLLTATSRVYVRLSDTPETVVRPAGTVHLI